MCHSLLHCDRERLILTFRVLLFSAQVRKAAVKVILAVVQARPDLLSDTWTACGLQLVRRFKEREENVRLDIMHCFESLIQASCSSGNGANASAGAGGATKKAGGAASSSSSSSSVDKTGRTSLAALLDGATSTANGNNKVVQAVVKACCEHLAGTNTSAKTKSAVFALLRALVSALNVSPAIFCFLSQFVYLFTTGSILTRSFIFIMCCRADWIVSCRS